MKDDIFSENKEIAASQFLKEKNYWMKKFSGEVSFTHFPYDSLPQSFLTEKHAKRKNIIEQTDFNLDGEIYSLIKRLTKESHPKLHMVLITGLVTLLHIYTGSRDITIGTPIDKQDIEGEFTNTVLPLRNLLSDSITFKQLLLQVRQTIVEAIENQNYPIEALIKQLDLEQKTGTYPLFDTALLLEEIHDIKYLRHVKPNILFSFKTKQKSIHAIVNYDSSFFEKTTIEKISTHFTRVLGFSLKHLDHPLKEINLLSEKEKEALIIQFNNTTTDYPKEKLIYQLFEEQVKKNPFKPALIFEEKNFTYDELNKKKNHLAEELKKNAIAPDKVVGILLEKSIDLVVAVLGILKAGGAYLPLDIEYPEERKKYILKDSGTDILLTDSIQARQLDWKGQVLDIKNSFVHPELGNIPIQDIAKPNNLAYIIYTSGSTGIPKGVMIQHQGLTNYIWWAAKKYADNCNSQESAAFPLYTSISFDLTVTSIYTPLITGNYIVIFGESKELLVEKIFEGNQVNVVKLTPTHLKLMRNKFIGNQSNIKRLIVGGENFETLLANDTYRNLGENIEIFNEYGPTEAVVGCMIYKYNPNTDHRASIPIGKPADNVQIYLLNKNKNPVPPGILGEIFIAGDGVARGYLNRPQLTQEKFINILTSQWKLFPFSTPKMNKLYKTGDLGRWLPNGNMEFLGRQDHQVKIRGNRIELGEIENKLLHHHQIKEAVVTTREMQPGETYLCAYVVMEGSEALSGIREFLSLHLPEYMIPSYFVNLDTLPLDTHGKLNRKALPDPEGISLEEELEYTPPRTNIEKKLVEIWQSVLGRENIGINENFFMIGGDSIRSIQIISRLNAAGYNLEMNKLFENPIISDLATHVTKLKRIPNQSTISGIVPLTPIQHRFFANSGTHHSHFNQSVMLFFKERYPEEAIREIFKKIQDHHDVLRTVYTKKNGIPFSINMGSRYPFSLEVIELRDKDNKQVKEILEVKVNEIQASIDLEKGPLMKLGLFHLNDGDRLVIIIHHLVVDGVSWRILFEDIETLMEQHKKKEPLKLPLKSDSYKLWAEKLSEYANSPSFLNEKGFWTQVERSEIPLIKKDKNYKSNRFCETTTASFTLALKETKLLLTKVNKAFGTQINDILLTALGLGVNKTWGCKRVLISQEGHGRENIINDIDITRTIGWFTSVFPVGLEILPENEERLDRQIKKVKETLRQIPNHGIGYGILRYLTATENKKEIEFNLNPQINFNYLGQFDADVRQRSFIIAEESTGNPQKPTDQREFDLEISGIIANNHLSITVIFNQYHFKKETIDQFLSHFKSELQRIITFCSTRDKIELTPSDFTYPSLSIETVEQLSRQFPNQIQDVYLLTPMQQGMLFHSLYNNESSAYFEQTAYRLHGQLNIELVEKSLNELFKRHDILRTIFIYEGYDTQLQVVLQKKNCDFHYKDISQLTTQVEKEQFIKESREKDRKQPFNLSKDVLMRVTVIEVNTEEFELIWSFHHIVMDGWCIGIINAEFFEIYNSLLSNRENRLPKLPPYKTYIQWLEKQDKETSKDYWKTYLQSYEETAVIPRLIAKVEEPANSPQEYKDEHYQVLFDRETTSALNRITAKNHVTINVITQTLWGIILGKYNGSEDVVFGAVVSGRPFELKGVESMVGLFINTIPVRIRFNPEIRFSELLQKNQKEALAAEPHHYYPLAEIQSESNLKNNLIDHIFIFENFPVAQQIQASTSQNEKGKNKKNLTLQVSNINVYEQSNYDINVILGSTGDQLGIRFDYNGNAINSVFISIIGNHFKQVINQIIEDDELKIDEISLLGDAEKKEILENFNNTSKPYPQNKTLRQLFTEQVEHAPHHIALTGKKTEAASQQSNRELSFETKNSTELHLTYETLNLKSQQLSGMLIKNGIEADSIVAIMIERSPEMIIGLLAIINAGSAYLPIDPATPQDRFVYLLKDSGTNVLLKNGPLNTEISPSIANRLLMSPNRKPSSNTNPIMILDISNLKQEPASTKSLCKPLKPSNLAYIIYTSGSTGQPKGVMVEQKNVIRLVKHSNFITYPKNSRLLLTGAFIFDITTFEIWGSLLNTVNLYLANQEIIMEGEILRHFLKKNHINILHLVPQLFNQLVEQDIEIFASLDYFLVGGDLVRPGNLNKVREKYPHLNILHMYGPTENTTFSTFYHVDRNFETKIPIGKPIANSFACVVDHKRRLQPVGVVGELIVGGRGIVRGYLNNPELTSKKFQLWGFDKRHKQSIFTNTSIKTAYWNRNTFISPTPSADSSPISIHTLFLTVYCTGDLARWHPDGNLEFLGRSDHQVKIRGIRIELEEIEKQLIKHKKITEAVVIAREASTGNEEQKTIETNKYLCAYLIFKKDTEKETEDILSPLELKEYLQNILPEYMLPTYFVPMKNLPLTATGKIDRKALPNPEDVDMGESENYQPPNNKIEQLLVDIWKSVLIKEKIGINDNFFMIGGDSIKAIQIVSRLKKAGYTITIREIFQQRTISQLAPRVKKSTKEADQSTIMGKIPLTPIQEEFFAKCKIHSHHFNQAMMLYTESNLDKEIITLLFKKILEHHDALRMTYNRDKNRIIQSNHGLDYPLEIHELDLRGNENSTEALESSCNRIQASIDLEKGPLIKLGLFHLEKGNLLLIVIHHLVMDGVSWRILLEDIEKLYSYYSNYQVETKTDTSILPLKTDSFKVWAEKLREYASGEEITHQLTYWQKVESTPVPPLPTDHETELWQRKIKYNKAIRMELNREQTKDLLEKANQAYNTETYDLLLTTLALTINRWQKHENVMVNLEGHGREEIIEDIDITRTIGWFTSKFPVILKVPSEQPNDHNIFYSEAIKINKEQLRAIPLRGIGYGILRYLTPLEKKQNIVFNKEPEINFNYLGEFNQTNKNQNSAPCIFNPIDHGAELTNSLEQEDQYKININSMVVGGQFVLMFGYNQNQYDKKTVENLAKYYKDNLVQILQHCLNKDTTEKTLSDFSARMDQEELENVYEAIDDLPDI